jgi:hypothetical protein
MPSVLDQLAQAVAPAPLTDALCLSEFLDLMPDPRGFRGRRYLWSALVAAATASVLAGARSLTATTEWISDTPVWACRAPGFPLDPLTGTVSVPHPHTLRRLLVHVDALDRAIGAFLTARTTAPRSGLRAIAVDGKVLRGSRTTTAVTLPAAMDPSRQVLAQRQIADRAMKSLRSSPCWAASTSPTPCSRYDELKRLFTTGAWIPYALTPDTTAACPNRSTPLHSYSGSPKSPRDGA